MQRGANVFGRTPDRGRERTRVLSRSVLDCWKWSSVGVLRLTALLREARGFGLLPRSGNRGNCEVKSDLLQVSRGQISGPAQIAFEHLVPMPTIGIPIRPCPSPGFLA